jgi:ATP/maltotriose-dependent transcriptional regulator MalT
MNGQDALTDNCSPAPFDDGLQFGICIKDQSWLVKHQNPKCVDACGNMINKICQETCFRLSNKSRLSNNQKSGIEAFREKEFLSQVCDVAIVKSNGTITSVLCSLFTSNAELAVRLKQIGLTKREIEIHALRQRGYKNIEIEHRLKISHCTLKTHIRNLLKKMKTFPPSST